ncbi:hypothetical protein [Rahnella selenatireducens]|uniref:hypothetical protein n=1 Tax=Rahnella selenatireducens TaxID=3389797 RepID=UPI0039694678
MMKKINHEMGFYILLTVFMLISWGVVIILYYPLLLKPMDYHDTPVLAAISACVTGGWIGFSIIVLPAFSSRKLFEE